MSSAFAGLPLVNLHAFRSTAGVHRRPPMVVIATTTSPLARRRVRGGPYEVLRVKETASGIEIKAAYRSLAKRFHPDVAAVADDGGTKFLEIQQAYDTLSDPLAREQYDLSIRRVGFGVGLAGDSQLRCRRWETDQCW